VITYKIILSSTICVCIIVISTTPSSHGALEIASYNDASIILYSRQHKKYKLL